MKRYRVGLMVGNKSIDYVHAIRMGVENTLDEAGHVLIAISDLIPFHSRVNASSYFRVAFEVTARLGLDAVIVPAGTIASYLTDEYQNIYELLDVLDAPKTVVIERDVPGLRCITKDNAPGMHECMRHLIEECGYKKIAFIGGPKSSTSAREREDIYFEEMHAHGLDTPESLLTYGEFSGECGDAIDELIDNNPGLEAIACSCDLIAHSVYRVMRRRRLAVGRDIAVTGFDDLSISAHLNPPLSTVRMTGYDLGCMAAREALRLCEGLPQQEHVLSSTFIARGSCGAGDESLIDQFRELIVTKPFPQDQIVDIFVDSTLMMAGRYVEKDFRAATRVFVETAREAYLRHVAGSEETDAIFDSQDLSVLFNRSYRDLLSLEGFQSAAIALLRALLEETSDRDVNWVFEQIGNVHQGIARMLNALMQDDRAAHSKREWTSFHMIDDAVRETSDVNAVYRLILQDLHGLGVNRADLYLLADPVEFIGARSFALSDTLRPVGRLIGGSVRAIEGARTVALQDVLGRLVPHRGGSSAYTVGGIMAGNELLGIVAFEHGTLDADGQLIATLNLGIALKHMQMIANERESNELLSKSNLLLEQQSHYDEMTGVLNRRGFMSKLRRMLNIHQGRQGVLLYLDLDGLKKINDTYGHDNGDEAIRQTTCVLSACLPPDTILGRLGGDEFVAFVLVESESELESLGRSIEAGMATFNATHSYPFELAISYGGVVVTIWPDSFENITKTMVLADERLYEMKKVRGSRSARREI